MEQVEVTLVLKWTTSDPEAKVYVQSPGFIADLFDVLTDLNIRPDTINDETSLDVQKKLNEAAGL